MILTDLQKENLKQKLVACLRTETEIRKIVIFGSFLHSNEPRDLDVAVFQDSKEGYLPLALRYRQRTREIAREIPMDIFPVRPNAPGGPIFAEISRGESIYER
jgi:uncharacterized protein